MINVIEGSMASSGKVYNQRYRKIKNIGKGAYGQIKLCEDLKPEPGQESKYIALKKMKIDQSVGINFTSIREIKILQQCQHPNIMKLLDIFTENQSLYLVMELMSCDLAQ